MALDILFLGRLFPREKEAEIKAKMKTGMQDAANALQWNIIDGLEVNNCGRIKILNYLPVDSFPHGYADRRIEEFSFSHTDKYESEDLNVGCTNRSIIKHFVNVAPFKREVKKWVLRSSVSKKVLILYTASAMFLSLAKYAKQLEPSVECCCIIADLPEFVTASDLHGIRKAYSVCETHRCNTLYKYVDKFVLLTKQMAERLRINVPYTIVEGIAPESDRLYDTPLANKYRGKKYILYSGTLNPKFGIEKLLKAFAMIRDENLHLVICGFGQAEAMIREQAVQDPRISFLGRLDRQDVLALQQNALVLVNPRQNNEEFTKYSFPSKTMEYLASGVPVVAYKLDGIPEEYDDYIFYVPDNSPKTLAQTIVSVCEKPVEERNAWGGRAKKFVLENKNKVEQTKKILLLFE